jgi:glycosyltransferase involved in cell wall biosynthesis
MHITKVALSLGKQAVFVPNIVDPYYVIKNRDDALIVMSVDPLHVLPWFLLARDLKVRNVKCYYYGTTEGKLKKSLIPDWAKPLEFIAVSNYVMNKLVEAGLRVVGVVHHGIDPEEIEQVRSNARVGLNYMQKLGLDPSKHYIVTTVSQAHPRKGLAWYNEVIGIVEKKDPTVKFLVITQDKGLNYFGKHNNLVVTTDFGKLSRLTILSIIRNSYILGFPSLAEGFGLPVLEAMGLGVPVVHARLPPLMEFSVGFTVQVTDISYYNSEKEYPSGIIYEHHLWDPQEFADMIIYVIDLYRNKKDELNESRAKAMRKASQYYINKQYSKLLQLYG